MFDAAHSRSAACDPLSVDPFSLSPPLAIPMFWARVAAETWFSASHAFAVEASAPYKDVLDGLLYDTTILTPGDRAAAAELAEAGPRALAAVRPQGARPPRVYETARAALRGADALAGAVVAPTPGAGALGAVAFARQVADALDAAVIALAPEQVAPDAIACMLAPDESDPSPGDETLVALFAGARTGGRIAVSHGLGGGRLCRAFCGPFAETHQRGDSPLRAITIGGAPATPPAVRAHHALGGLDGYGWSISDPDARIAVSPPFAGHRLSRWPGPPSFDLDGLLANVARRP